MKISISFCLLFSFKILFGQNLVSSSQLPNKASIRALQALSSQEIWLSGSKGSIFRSLDGGLSFQNLCPEAYAAYDFRGIYVFNSKKIIAMSAGLAEEGKAFLLVSTDSGITWQKTFSLSDKGVFFDSIKFINAKEGFVLGDAIDAKPFLLKTKDGGKTWNRIYNLPDILKGEASFAASNSCISTYKKCVWFNTQNRVFISKNMGKSWEVRDTPFESGSSVGIFGTHFFNNNDGVAVGGDYLPSENQNLLISTTTDGGLTWKENYKGLGLIESVDRVFEDELILASLQGLLVFSNNQITSLSTIPLHVIDCVSNKCFVSGGNGHVAVYDFKKK